MEEEILPLRIETLEGTSSVTNDFSAAFDDFDKTSASGKNANSGAEQKNNTELTSSEMLGSSIGKDVPDYLRPVNKNGTVLARDIKSKAPVYTPTKSLTDQLLSSGRSDATKTQNVDKINNFITELNQKVTNVTPVLGNLVGGVDINKILTTTSSTGGNSGISKLLGGLPLSTTETNAASKKIVDEFSSAVTRKIGQLEKGEAEQAMSDIMSSGILPCNSLYRASTKTFNTKDGSINSKLTALRTAQYVLNPALFARDVGNKINGLANNPSVKKAMQLANKFGGLKKLTGVGNLLKETNNKVKSLTQFSGIPILSSVSGSMSTMLDKVSTISSLTSGIGENLLSTFSSGFSGAGGILSGVGGSLQKALGSMNILNNPVLGSLTGLSSKVGNLLGGGVGSLTMELASKIGGPAGGLLFMSAGAIQNAATKGITGAIDKFTNSAINKGLTAINNIKATTGSTVTEIMSRSYANDTTGGIDRYKITNSVDMGAQPNCSSYNYIDLGSGASIKMSAFVNAAIDNTNNIISEADKFNATIPSDTFPVLTYTSGRQPSLLEKQIALGLVATEKISTASALLPQDILPVNPRESNRAILRGISNALSDPIHPEVLDGFDIEDIIDICIVNGGERDDILTDISSLPPLRALLLNSIVTNTSISPLNSPIKDFSDVELAIMRGEPSTIPHTYFELDLRCIKI